MSSAQAKFALVISLLVILLSGLVSRQTFDNLPHLEDEFAYVWQAQVMASGELTLPEPEFRKSFLVPFVVDFEGQRFGKYPLGWPALLSTAIRIGIRNWINPILAGLGCWLTYLLGRRLFGETPGLVAVILMTTSPILYLQSGTLLSHAWSLVLVTAFCLFWIDLTTKNNGKYWIPKSVTAGLCLGTLGITRPLTMAAVSVPFMIHGLWILIRGHNSQKIRVLVIGITAMAILPIQLIWQWAATGDPWTNLYSLWWPYDRVGFGPGIGVTEAGHSLGQAWTNTKHSLRAGASDLFGWGTLSWIFLPFGIWAASRSRAAYLNLGVFISLVVVYGFYWIGAWLLGPRYYFESLSSLAVLSAAGISLLAGWLPGPELDQAPLHRLMRLRSWGMIALFAILVGLNLRYYLPSRLASLEDLYGISRAKLEVFQSPEFNPYLPALVVVDSERWMGYANLLELQEPDLSSPLIFAWSRGQVEDRLLADHYRQTRTILYYYPDLEPGQLYTFPVD